MSSLSHRGSDQRTQNMSPISCIPFNPAATVVAGAVETQRQLGAHAALVGSTRRDLHKAADG